MFDFLKHVPKFWRSMLFGIPLATLAFAKADEGGGDDDDDDDGGDPDAKKFSQRDVNRIMKSTKVAQRQRIDELEDRIAEMAEQMGTLTEALEGSGGDDDEGDLEYDERTGLYYDDDGNPYTDQGEPLEYVEDEHGRLMLVPADEVGDDDDEEIIDDDGRAVDMPPGLIKHYKRKFTRQIETLKNQLNDTEMKRQQEHEQRLEQQRDNLLMDLLAKSKCIDLKAGARYFLPDIQFDEVENKWVYVMEDQTALSMDEMVKEYLPDYLKTSSVGKGGSGALEPSKKVLNELKADVQKVEKLASGTGRDEDILKYMAKKKEAEGMEEKVGTPTKG